MSRHNKQTIRNRAANLGARTIVSELERQLGANFSMTQISLFVQSLETLMSAHPMLSEYRDEILGPTKVEAPSPQLGDFKAPAHHPHNHV